MMKYIFTILTIFSFACNEKNIKHEKLKNNKSLIESHIISNEKKNQLIDSIYINLTDVKRLKKILKPTEAYPCNCNLNLTNKYENSKCYNFCWFEIDYTITDIHPIRIIYFLNTLRKKDLNKNIDKFIDSKELLILFAGSQNINEVGLTFINKDTTSFFYKYGKYDYKKNHIKNVELNVNLEGINIESMYFYNTNFGLFKIGTNKGIIKYFEFKIIDTLNNNLKEKYNKITFANTRLSLMAVGL